VNLFPNKAPIPSTMMEVTQRVQNLQFANKTFEDLKMLRRINGVAELMRRSKTCRKSIPSRTTRPTKS